MPVPAPDLANVYQVRLEGTYQGEACANVFGVADLLGTQTVDDVADNFENALSTVGAAAVGTTYRADVSNQRSWTNLHVTAYDAAAPFVTDQGLAGAYRTGSNTGQGLPYQLAICVSLTTGQASRRKRGRLFDYGFAEAANSTAGRIESVTQAAVEAFWQAFRTELTANDLGWGVISRGWINEGGDDTRESFAQSFTLITNVSVRDTLWDTIRSRVPS